MIVLDLNDDEELVANITGNDFYKSLNSIKNINGAKYNSENKLWVLPKSMEVYNTLNRNNIIGTKGYDKYQLTGTKAPDIKDAVNIFFNEIEENINKFAQKYDIDSLNYPLKNFQILGVSVALYFLMKDNGFLIADDMGLGKTIEALAIINSLKKQGLINKILVSCPKNVKFQWGHEIDDFSNLSYTVIDGYNKEKRLSKYKQDSDIYIINHDLLINDGDKTLIKDINADLVIADEIHYFKSKTAKRTKALKKLNPDYKLGLTGTPMQNKPDDMHSIFEFLIPGFLGNWKSFRKKYILFDFKKGYPVGYKNLFSMKKIVSTRMIRRKTKDVTDNLPDKHTKTHTIEMKPEQKKVHSEIEAMIDELKLKLDSKKIDKSKKETEEGEDLDGKIMGLMNIQKEISDDLRLLELSDKKWINDLVSVKKGYQSPKIRKLKSLLKNILDYNKEFKVLVFSKFARMVNLIKDDLLREGYINDVSIIYGQMDEKSRDNEIQKFKNKDNCRILVMSDAGAEGYNLQNASHLINFDLPWNPAKIDQRAGRIIRIGSPWDKVFVSNIVSRQSVDQKVLEAIERKRQYFDKIVENTADQERALKRFIKEVI